LVVVLAVPIVLLASNLIAIAPARWVARTKPAEALRSE
jgi:ABC-type lipoprotein release transport system permease subunit